MSQCILQRRQPILSLSILSKAVKNRIAFVEIDYRTAGVGLCNNVLGSAWSRIVTLASTGNDKRYSYVRSV